MNALEGREAGGAAFALPPPAYCRAVLGRTTVFHLAVLMAAKGAAQGSGLWINGETLTQRANTEAHVRLSLGIAGFAFLPQSVARSDERRVGEESVMKGSSR